MTPKSTLLLASLVLATAAQAEIDLGCIIITTENEDGTTTERCLTLSDVNDRNDGGWEINNGWNQIYIPMPEGGRSESGINDIENPVDIPDSKMPEWPITNKSPSQP